MSFRVFTIVVVALIGLVASAHAQPFTRVTAGVLGTDRADSPGASWVDYDGDDDLDLFISNRSTNALNPNNILYRNDGEEVFTRVDAGALTAVGAIGHCWADYDNDGDLDVALAGLATYVTPAGGSPHVLLRNDGGTFVNATANLTTSTDVRFWSCSWGDYDQDGFVDLLLIHPTGFLGNPSLTNQLYRNRGDGTFEQITGIPPTTGQGAFTVSSWSDFDLDGDVDLFIGSGPVSVAARDFLYRNQLTETGNAVFVRINDDPIGTDLVDGQVWNWIDYDNDGDLDAYLTNYSGGTPRGLQNNLYHNDGGTYTRITTGSIVSEIGQSLANTWGDFDNDGDLDVFVTNDNANSRYYRNNGDGTFSSLSTLLPASTSGVSWGATLGDYDDDGDLDLFVSNVGSPPSLNYLYRNDLANDNHWLKVRAVGVTSNRTAIGAKLFVRATIDGESVTQHREISSQNTFCGSNSFDVHVGLGDAAVVEELRIEWPSGTVDVYTDVAADEFLLAVEGQSVSPVSREAAEVPSRDVELHPAYPNPLASRTTIRYELRQSASVSLRVYDVLGREVVVLDDGWQPAGMHEVVFNASGLPNGAYTYRLQAGGTVQSRTLVVLKPE